MNIGRPVNQNIYRRQFSQRLNSWHSLARAISGPQKHSNLKLLSQFCKTHQREKLRQNIYFIIITIKNH